MANELNNFYNRIFSAVYDPFMKSAEDKILGKMRSALLGNLQGNILEIGCGTGVNFRYYSESASVLALEPSQAMREKAQKRIIDENAR